MDDYWMKSEKKEIAAKKLDEDMDEYWDKKGEQEIAEGEQKEAGDGEMGDDSAGDGGSRLVTEDADAEDAKKKGVESEMGEGKTEEDAA